MYKVLASLKKKQFSKEQKDNPPWKRGFIWERAPLPGL
jgi:hypothetical protein